MDGSTQSSSSSWARAILVAAIALICLPGCASMREDGATLAQAVAAFGPQKSKATSRPGVILSEHVELVEPEFKVTSESKARLKLAWARMLQAAGRNDEATSFYEAALKEDPNSVNVLLALARNYSDLGRPQAAMSIYRRAQKQHPKNSAVYNNMGLDLANQKQHHEAIYALRNAVRLDPSNSKYHNNLANTLAKLGNYDDAWEEFRAAVGPAKAHYNVAFMLACAGELDRARKHLEQATRLMPDLQPANGLLAMLRKQSAAGQSIAHSGQQELKDMPPLLVPERTESANGYRTSQLEHAGGIPQGAAQLHEFRMPLADSEFRDRPPMSRNRRNQYRPAQYAPAQYPQAQYAPRQYAPAHSAPAGYAPRYAAPAEPVGHRCNHPGCDFHSKPARPY